MSSEAPKTQIPTPEHLSASPDEIAVAFVEAQRSAYKLTDSDTFHKRCLERDVKPNDDFGTAGYWDTFADVAYDTVTKIHSRSGNSLLLNAFELLTATPAYIYAETNLNDGPHNDVPTRLLSPANKEQRQADRTTASYFNSIIRNFAVEYPQVSAHGLSHALVNFANKTIDDRAKLQEGVKLINSSIRGAQHELAFGQVLRYTGRNFRPASLEEDLRGIDYVILNADGTTIEIDVKGSMHELLERGIREQPYARGEDGHLIMYSLVQDAELRKHFFIADELAAQKAPALNALLDEAQGIKAQAI